MALSRRSFATSVLGGLAARLVMAGRPRPRLCVLVILGQMRAEALLAADNPFIRFGLRRILQEGAYFPDCRFLSASFTSSGLATILSGSYPENHGIIADSWYERRQRRMAGAAPEYLEATTLADEISSEQTNRLAVVALEKSHGVLLAGSSPAPIFAMDAKGEFQAHRYPGESADWLVAFQRAHQPEKFQNTGWLALGAQPGSPPLRLLTYDAEKPEDFYWLYKASPFAQAAQLELVRQLIEKEKFGQGEALDFIPVVLSSTALLGYETGAQSPLMSQMVMHLDQELETTLEALDRIVGAEHYTLVLTAAHGAPPEPGGERRQRMAVNGEQIARGIDGALSQQLDTAGTRIRYVERYVYPFLYLRAEQLRRPEMDLRRLRRLAGEAALEQPGVAGYYTADGDCSHRGDWLPRFRNSFHAGRSGDVMLAYKPEYVEEYGAGRGVSYGSLYNYDTRVPLIFYGPQFQAETFETPVEAIDIAPTLARVMGTNLPSSSTGRVLAEAFLT